MAEKSAGRVLLIPKGVFTIGTNYTPLDFVAFGSNNYVCKKATDGTKTPVEDTASWQMLAAGFDSHNIAAEYSEEAIYHAGDICISGGNLYKAKQDINAAEAFTAGHWEEITVGQELTSLETTKADASDVTTLKEKVGTAALTTTATDLSGAVNEVKAATDTNASAITQLNSESCAFTPSSNVSNVEINVYRKGNNISINLTFTTQVEIIAGSYNSILVGRVNEEILPKGYVNVFYMTQSKNITYSGRLMNDGELHLWCWGGTAILKGSNMICSFSYISK